MFESANKFEFIVIIIVLSYAGNIFSQLCRGIPESSSNGVVCFIKRYAQVDLETSCSFRFPFGTTLKYRCRAPFLPQYSTRNYIYEATCQANSKWNGDFEDFRCVLDFGYFDPNAAKQGRVKPLIQNGIVTEHSAFPWTTALFIWKDGMWTYVCGGTLIDLDFILTAAHCTIEDGSIISANLLRAVFATDIASYDEILRQANPKVQQRGVKQITVHPEYYGDEENLYNDLALLKLGTPVEPTTSVLPVFLPTQIQAWNIDEGKRICQINGFGYTNPATIPSLPLLYGVNVTVNSGQCVKSVDESPTGARFKRSKQICTQPVGIGMLTFATSTTMYRCLLPRSNGDSGSGAYLQDGSWDTPRWYLQGIVSYGIHPTASRSREPQYNSCFKIVVLTKVYFFLDWINEKKYEQRIKDSTTRTFTTTPRPPQVIYSFPPISRVPSPPPSVHPTKQPWMPPAVFPDNTSNGVQDLTLLAIGLHNNYRRRHSAPSLSFDNQLTQEAQAYANYVANANYVLQPKFGIPYGQNVFEFTGTAMISTAEATRRAVEEWYNGNMYYNWNSPLVSHVFAFTFTQVVWKSSLRLGLGVAVSSAGNQNRIIVIAFYSPRGNVHSEQSYKENVMRPQY